MAGRKYSADGTGILPEEMASSDGGGGTDGGGSEGGGKPGHACSIQPSLDPAPRSSVLSRLDSFASLPPSGGGNGRRAEGGAAMPLPPDM
mmetsp:Transcript_44692/g.143675  ORF Transcript_44692/g.143675 Transcript_44692/m.143675 type:complete len:90 (-) Transcript_44692:922-1191(-)